MCSDVKACDEVKHLETKHKTDITKYWSIISGLVALLITLVIFYANSLHAIDQVQDHEQRIRSIEKTVTSTEILLKEIAKDVGNIGTKLDKYIEREK